MAERAQNLWVFGSFFSSIWLSTYMFCIFILVFTVWVEEICAYPQHKEIEENGKIPFLDCLVIRDNNRLRKLTNENLQKIDTYRQITRPVIVQPDLSQGYNCTEFDETSYLLQRIGHYSPSNKRIQNMHMIIFKCLHLDQYPLYLKELLSLRSVDYSMRGTDILGLPQPVSTTYDLNSFGYTAANSWNALPDKLRTLSSLYDFILAIRRYRLIN